jgi:hypothetical protein
MSPKSDKPSSTAVITSDNWVNTPLVHFHSGTGKTSVLSDPNAVIISGQSRVSGEGKAEIVLSVDPSAVTKRMAIRKLNEELEGRYSPTDTYASKTAG